MTYRVEQGEPELLGVLLVALYLQHGEPARLPGTAGPGAQQRRLPAARLRRDDRHLPRYRAIQGSDQVTPVDQPGSRPSHTASVRTVHDPAKPGQSPESSDACSPAWWRGWALPIRPNRKEILRERRAAREPRSDPAAVSLPRRRRCQRAAAAAPGADIGPAAARRCDRDRSRTGRRPHRRDHHRRSRTSPCCPVLPRRRIRTGRRLPSRWPGLADRPADACQGHLRRLPARPRAPVSGRGR